MKNENRLEIMNEESRKFLKELSFIPEDYPHRPPLVFLDTPAEFFPVIENISNEFVVDDQKFEQGEEFICFFVRKKTKVDEQIKKLSQKPMAENGLLVFLYPKLTSSAYKEDVSNEELYAGLISANWKQNTKVNLSPHNWEGKSFRLADRIETVHYNHVYTNERNVKAAEKLHQTNKSVVYQRTSPANDPKDSRSEPKSPMKKSVFVAKKVAKRK
ncbi:unnamed protein product [Didymodactylos carnosus]|uniref:Uncharacterized protein n=1 Tax=Didymodactylos carnosus TaxID=1234261 RepID=A0A814HSS2_9BILA|nr:unnamed protein product [Didymodactylos carnosus]CAF1350864.1 unnamed protein product [Didymodactylos carnosus]CAF3786413.1 unnamed protein product [Didymodactylos carnosus]CAF4161400.1 unnamed protein product [Didymodactylos carnosus]